MSGISYWPRNQDIRSEQSIFKTQFECPQPGNGQGKQVLWPWEDEFAEKYAIAH